MRTSIRTLLPLLMFACMAAASDDPTDRNTLKGIKSVCTIVEVNGPTEGFSLTKQELRAEIDGRLAAAGIPEDKDATSCLYLNVRPLAAMGKSNKPVGLYALEMTIQLLQTVAVTRDATIKTYAPTWSYSNLATVPSEDLRHTARQMTVDLADRFVDAFRSVNPK